MSNTAKRLTIRQGLLAFTLFGLVLVGLKLVIDPKAANRQPANFSFPQSVSAPAGWELTKSVAIAPENPKLEELFLDIYEYEFKRSDLAGDLSAAKDSELKIGMYYTVSTRGEYIGFLIKRFKIEITPSRAIAEFKNQESGGNADGGYYNLYSYKGRSHLVACINPQGSSTVTDKQFLANRNKYDFQADRYLPWFLGQVALRDFRCLWVDMSMAESPEIAYPILKEAWTPWYAYWQKNFPAY
jgi:cyanosortase A-associated protein